MRFDTDKSSHIPSTQQITDDPNPPRTLLSRRRMTGAISLGLVGLLVQACGGGAPSPTPGAPIVTVIPAASTPTRLAESPTSVAASSPTAEAKPSSTTAASTGAKVSTAMTSPDYAVQAFLWGNPNTARDLKLVADAGLRWVKQSIEWRYVEPHNKGKFDWGEPDRVVDAINSAGLKIIARVDNQPVWARNTKDFPVVGPPDKMSDYGDFVSALATRYKGRIHAYEIWNEPNLAREWGNKPPDAKGYIEMLKVAYKAIKAIDPAAVVISGGLAPTTAYGAVASPDVDFLKAMYDAGLKGNVDMVGVHAAGYKAPPEMSPDDIAKDTKYNHNEPGAGRIYGFRHVEDLRKVMVDNGDSERRVAVMEMGWTADTRPNSLYKWHSVTEAEKADYLVRAFDFAKKNWNPWIGVMSVIYISAPHWTTEDEQYYWNITNPDGTVRPAYDALKKMPKQ